MKLTAGPGDSAGHQGSLYVSWDFKMPIGTPVLAARSGIVSRVVHGCVEGGHAERFKGRGNVVYVLHADGTFAEYAHLSPVALVEIGSTYRQGTRSG